jgi:hypothetical protein
MSDRSPLPGEPGGLPPHAGRRRGRLLWLATILVLLGSAGILVRSEPDGSLSWMVDRLRQLEPGLGPDASPAPPGLTAEQLWDLRVRPYLRLELWREELAYDAGQVLQVPLHAAFSLGKTEWIEQFSRHFREFMVHGGRVPRAKSPLNQLQYLYLASRFIALACQTGRVDLIPPGLVNRVGGRLNRLWFRQPAWMWDRAAFHGGIAERVRWKLSHRKVRRSYYRAVVDQELYPMAIAADLWQGRRLAGLPLRAAAAVKDALDLSRLVFQQRVVPVPGGGWLMQPGVWADHPDAAFAGTTSWSRSAAPKRRARVAEDSSHSHRYPLWLTSLLEAYPADSAERRFYSRLRAGLADQLYGRVLLAPDAGFSSYRTTNYMDGGNGWYRRGYRTLAAGDGYGPFELSGTFLLGWWGFLEDPRVCQAYREQAARFPLPTSVVLTYIGPGTTRYQPEMVSIRNAYHNGHRLLLVILAGAYCARAA